MKPDRIWINGEAIEFQELMLYDSLDAKLALTGFKWSNLFKNDRVKLFRDPLWTGDSTSIINEISRSGHLCLVIYISRAPINLEYIKVDCSHNLEVDMICIQQPKSSYSYISADILDDAEHVKLCYKHKAVFILGN